LISIAPDNIPALEYWHRNERQFPGLAIMAQDILCIPAASVEVERLFNVARDVCHYRRGRLHPDTIRNIMLAHHADNSLSTMKETVIDDLVPSESFTVEQIREEEEQRANELAEAMDIQYISENEDVETIVVTNRPTFLRRRREIHQDLHPWQLSTRELAARQRIQEERDIQEQNPMIWNVPSSPSTSSTASTSSSSPPPARSPTPLPARSPTPLPAQSPTPPLDRSPTSLFAQQPTPIPLLARSPTLPAQSQSQRTRTLRMSTRSKWPRRTYSKSQGI
jgi:hAT family C-terminal dimerisation region